MRRRTKPFFRVKVKKTTEKTKIYHIALKTKKFFAESVACRFAPSKTIYYHPSLCSGFYSFAYLMQEQSIIYAKETQQEELWFFAMLLGRYILNIV